MWSILAALYAVTKNPQRVVNYVQHLEKLNFSGIPFSVQVGNILKCRKKNDISINEFGYEKWELYPFHLIDDGHKGNQLYLCHYCLYWIYCTVWAWVSRCRLTIFVGWPPTEWRWTTSIPFLSMETLIMSLISIWNTRLFAGVP